MSTETSTESPVRRVSSAIRTFQRTMTEIARDMAALALQGRRGVLSPKRSQGEIDAAAESFRRFVEAHPGLRIEQINKQLGTKTKDLLLPIAKLTARGAVWTKGEKRSTTYFASKVARGGRPAKRSAPSGVGNGDMEARIAAGAAGAIARQSRRSRRGASKSRPKRRSR